MAAVFLLGFKAALSEKLRGWFETGAYEVFVATSLTEGLAHYQRMGPEFLFVDVSKPAVNGLELLSILAKSDINTAVIFYAEAPGIDEVINAFRCGVLDFITGSELSQAKVFSAFSKAVEKVDGLQRQKGLEVENRSLRSRFDVLNADQEAGRLAQLKLFPETPFYFKPYRFSHHIIPSLLLSGDFIDYFEIDEEECGFYLADVSGHGASSAFITVLIKCLVNDIRKSEPRAGDKGIRSPSSVLQRLNQELVHMSLSKHVAMLYGVINRKNSTLVYSLAAHYPLPILIDGKKARFIGAAALPLGVLARLDVKEYTESLPETFSLVMFTDGIMDVLPQEGLLEKEQGLLEMLDTACTSLPAISKKLALGDIKNPDDDIGMLVIEG